MKQGKQCTYCGAKGDHDTAHCPWRPTAMDHTTSAHPSRNAIVILILLASSAWLVDLATGAPL